MIYLWKKRSAVVTDLIIKIFHYWEKISETRKKGLDALKAIVNNILYKIHILI